MKNLPWPIFIVFVSGLASAQSPACRQAWMPADAPAFCAWDTEPSLSEARTYPTVAKLGNNIYELGCFRYDAASGQYIYYDILARSEIGADGRLSPWSGESEFKTARSGAASAISGTCLFISGGSSSTASSLNYYDDIQYTRAGADGHLGSWTTSPNHLKTPRSNHSLVALTTSQGTFLQAVAGVAQMGADTVHLDTIEISKVNADCSVGPLDALANHHLKGGRSTPQALVVRINVVAGWRLG